MEDQTMTSPKMHSPEWMAEKAPEVVANDYGWERIETPGSREFFTRDQEGRRLWLKACVFRTWSKVSWEWPAPSPQYDDFIGILVFYPLGEFPAIIRAPRQTIERLKRVNKGVCRLRWDDETMAAVEYLYDRR
jgi:hypothetical protein